MLSRAGAQALAASQPCFLLFRSLPLFPCCAASVILPSQHPAAAAAVCFLPSSPPSLPPSLPISFPFPSPAPFTCFWSSPRCDRTTLHFPLLYRKNSRHLEWRLWRGRAEVGQITICPSRSGGKVFGSRIWRCSPPHCLV